MRRSTESDPTSPSDDLRQPLLHEPVLSLNFRNLRSIRRPSTLDSVSAKGGPSCSSLLSSSSTEVSTGIKFYDQYNLTGCKLLDIIDEAARDSSIDLNKQLTNAALLPAYVWEATYQLPHQVAIGSRIKIHAIHLAASLGSISVLEWLLEKSGCGHEVVSCRACIEREGHDSTPHYTPVMSALFTSKAEAVIWLLENGADPCLANSDGLTPLHMLAWVALPHLYNEAKDQQIKRIASMLVEKKADLTARTCRLEKRSDKEAELLRNKTALELAVWSTSYPNHMLHVLTQSFQCPFTETTSCIFKEVSTIAAKQPRGAVNLLDKLIKKHALQSIQKQLCHELMPLDSAGVPEQSIDDSDHMEQFVKIFMASPAAGAILLRLLMCEPAVGNAQRYPLPSYALLPNRQMSSAYQPIADKDKGLPVWECNWDKNQAPIPPKWHSRFAAERTGPLLRSNAYQVNVRVLFLPGILNAHVFGILSLLWKDWDHMKLFSQVPIASIVTCMWNHVSDPYHFSLFWELILLADLISLGVLQAPLTYHTMHMSVLIAYGMVSVMNLFSFFLVANGFTGLSSRFELLFKFRSGEIVGLCLLALVMLTDFGERTAYARFIVASNVVMRCIRIIAMMQVVPIIGPLVIAVSYSFMPMMGMFAFMFIVFCSFSFVFVIFKDPQRSIGFVLLYLYETLVLADRDAASSISGIDIAGEQTLDFDVEMFTGDGNAWVLMASAGVALVGMSIFSLVLLSLTIGMYTNYYEQMEPFSLLIFQQRRAMNSFSCMLQPSWQMARKFRRIPCARCVLPLVQHRRIVPAFISMLFLIIYGAAIAWDWGIFTASMLLAANMEICKVAMLLGIADKKNRNNFLWVCYRADWNDEFYRMNQLLDIQRGLDHVKQIHHRRMLDLSYEIQKTNQRVHDNSERMDHLSTIFTETNENVNRLIDSINAGTNSSTSLARFA